MSTPMLVHARLAARAAGLNNVSFFKDDMTQLAHAQDGSIDVVISSLSLHHLSCLDALDACFKQIARVLKPDGALYISDFGRLKSRKTIAYFVQRASTGANRTSLQDYEHSLLAAFSPDELKSAVSKYFGNRVKVFTSAVSPMMMVACSAPRANIPHLKDVFRTMYYGLPRDRRADVDQLRLFMRLGGLSNAF